MTILARRFTILTLIVAIFALAFAALVMEPRKTIARVHFGTSVACFHPASPNCTAAL